MLAAQSKVDKLIGVEVFEVNQPPKGPEAVVDFIVGDSLEPIEAEGLNVEASHDTPHDNRLTYGIFRHISDVGQVAHESTGK